MYRVTDKEEGKGAPLRKQRAALLYDRYAQPSRSAAGSWLGDHYWTTALVYFLAHPGHPTPHLRCHLYMMCFPGGC
jgi:hypothetical protein